MTKNGLPDNRMESETRQCITKKHEK